MDNELKAFEDFLTEGSRTAYPNPSRHGCPPREFLKNLAKHTIPIEETAACIDHLRSCSECFLDYTRFSETILREKRRMRFIALGSVAALLCVVVVGEYVNYRGSTSPGQSNTVATQNTTNNGTQAGLVATLHLEDLSVVRGQDAQSSQDRIPNLERGLLRLSIYLPPDSEAGTYTVQVLSKLGDKQSLLTFAGTAEVKDGHMVLHASANFSDMQPGRYYLAVRHDNGRWRYYRIALS